MTNKVKCPFCSNSDESMLKVESKRVEHKLVRIAYHCEVCSKDFVIWKDQ